MITKVLVANRGEIAVRAFRAAVELGIETVAMYTWEDRNSPHRLKADESYQIGEPGQPIRAYLDIETIVQTALDAGADAIYPGYGFVSENPDMAEACEAAGITFVGPTSEVLTLTGNKQRAHGAATAAGLPVLRQSPAVTEASEAMEHAAEIGFPIFVKAAAGGGGRGLRMVPTAAELPTALEAAVREAESAFGDPTVFLEQAVLRPRHIEVQLVGDGQGNVVHLFERDCSVQRRHQKVVEIAPAPNLDRDLRDRLCADAVRFGESINYRNAGTVEFLLDEQGRYVFIEMNPRIQVEHTVTEETTDIDLVQTQLKVASGATLPDIGLAQESIVQRGAALQCRITTEDPSNDFRPDTGRIVAYRQPGGAGIRLDGGNGYAGAEISPYFDSLLVKLTCRGRDFPAAVARASRALAEFRVRGLTTNLGYLMAVLEDPDFVAGRATTSFIDERPELTSGTQSGDRATKLLRYLGDVTVNQPNGLAPTLIEPSDKLPPRPSGEPPAGTKQRLDADGPEAFATWLRNNDTTQITDTTLRDAHQSILATRVRTIDLVAGARHIAHSTPTLLSLEAWGGATFDVAIRFLKEDPWQRLERIREAAPNICLQMLLRGRNTVGYSPYPDTVAKAFVREAQRAGIDIFRIFDAFNNIEQMRPAIDAVLETGALAEGTICYTSNISDHTETLYTLDYYLARAHELVEAGVHILAIKDMAGLLRAPAVRTLVPALRAEFDLPVVLHSHDTAGGQVATYLAAIETGVDAVDCAAAPLSGMTSQPSIAAVVAATNHTEHSTGITIDALASMEPYWESVRRMYRPFEAGLTAPTGTVYRHEIPGGQLSNLRQQAIALGLGDRFNEIEIRYAEVNKLLGNIIKVTPSSKVVGDLALQLVASSVSIEELESDPTIVDLPDSVIGFLHGDLGDPPGGWPEPFRTQALEGRRSNVELVELSPEDAAAFETSAARDTLTRLLFAEPYRDFVEHNIAFSDVSVLPTRLFLYGMNPSESDIPIGLERGVRLLVGLDAIGEPDRRGMRQVVFRLNGQIRSLEIRDRSVADEVHEAERADTNNQGHVAAPFHGVVTMKVAAGDRVEIGDPLAIIEAMKMESVIRSPHSGTVERLALAGTSAVESGDLLLVLRPAELSAEIDPE